MVVAFAGLSTAVYRMARQPFNEWAAEQMSASIITSSRVNNILDQAQEDHKSAVKERINSVSQLRDIVDVTKALFAISKETAKVEAEAFELKQKVAAAAEIKSVLDSWVRYEASLRELERKALASHVIDRARVQLEDSAL
ncbi:1022_t:CDS:2 [Acaulospora colombiana]|uniref:1022_t:CDS:1 n=1 Tax=Acaulospora colombiana TaxID=27376 RepID=A0ACA9K8S2_9GLOM|nr:1022_t:CDS:2 [Acaulospora colombiana]